MTQLNSVEAPRESIETRACVFFAPEKYKNGAHRQAASQRRCGPSIDQAPKPGGRSSWQNHNKSQLRLCWE